MYFYVEYRALAEQLDEKEEVGNDLCSEEEQLVLKRNLESAYDVAEVVFGLKERSARALEKLLK